MSDEAIPLTVIPSKTVTTVTFEEGGAIEAAPAGFTSAEVTPDIWIRRAKVYVQAANDVPDDCCARASQWDEDEDIDCCQRAAQASSYYEQSHMVNELLRLLGQAVD